MCTSLLRSLIPALALLAAPEIQAQHLTFEEWRDRAMVDIRLRPRYGDVEKTAEQKASDAEFVRLVLASDSTPAKASDHLVALGFEYLQRGDLTKAMYRFNQAFLLWPDNPNNYRGYGAFFLALDNGAMAHTMFRAGLSLDSTHAGLLTDEAGVYLRDHHAQKDIDIRASKDALDNALVLLRRAERHAPDDPVMLYRSAAAHLLRGQCGEARTYWQRCRNNGGRALDDAFEEQFARRCGP